ncbi:hypothetical protein DPMN_098923 [Dreissena polymorpha]|uniref:Uncharacterized protein n=1 Tax=Dreissena polymorpha TaxID=45954 RepID=A0A9D4R765_DREPO|nr:hypothetical protein DPMN_098923 [Dreissena polymorpha]
MRIIGGRKHGKGFAGNNSRHFVKRTVPKFNKKMAMKRKAEDVNLTGNYYYQMFQRGNSVVVKLGFQKTYKKHLDFEARQEVSRLGNIEEYQMVTVHIKVVSLPETHSEVNTHTAKAEQMYFAIRGGKAKRVDAASVVEAASVCGGKSHFAAKLRICLPRHSAIRDMMPSRCAS